MFKRLFAPRPAAEKGRLLYVAASRQARNPAFYLAGGVPDTPEGRFELYVLHVVLVLHRLKGQGEQAAETSQALFDSFLRNLDDGLRDMGVGDLSVGKKMRKLGEAFYGRVKSYDVAFGRLPDLAELTAVIGRTVYAGASPPRAETLAAYAARALRVLREQPLAGVLEGNVRWPEFADAA